MKLQIPANQYRCCHYVGVRVCVHRYLDGSLAIFHGPRKLADYDHQGKLGLKRNIMEQVNYKIMDMYF